MNQIIYGTFIFIFCSCAGNKKQEDANFFPVLSFIKSQVAHVDTSVYPIIKIVTIDDFSDTTHIKREEFRALAADFLNIPDLTNKDIRKKYKETKLFDETINKIILDYLPNDHDGEIRRQEVIIQPDQQAGDKVTTIFIDKWMNSKDSTVEKKMLWQVNKRFQVVTIIQKNNQPEKISKLEVVWNDFDPAE